MSGKARLLVTALAAGAVAFAAADAQAADVTAKVSKHRLRVESGSANAKITLRLSAGHKQRLVVDADSDGDADFVFDRRKFTAIVIDGRRGNDTIRIVEKYGIFTRTEQTTIRGGRGNDTIVGGSGRERIFSGPGADSVAGGGRADSVFLGPDDDVFKWKTGDGSDSVDGQDGLDTLRVDGLPTSESFAIVPMGARVRVKRAGKTAIVATSSEHADVHPRGGGDKVVVADLTGTQVTKVDVAFGPAGAMVNQLSVAGTNGDDVTTLASTSAGVTISGLAAQIALGPNADSDVVVVSGLAGDDVIQASGVPAGVASLVFHGGDGDDVLIGSDGPDVIFGNDGDDVLIGGPGIDLLDGGAGSNIVIQD